MQFEWDEAKRRTNIAKHGVDFALIAELFETDHAEIEDGRFKQNEKRFLALGRFEGASYIVAFARRNETIRIISAWKVGEKGKRRYPALFDRRPSRDEETR